MKCSENATIKKQKIDKKIGKRIDKNENFARLYSESSTKCASKGEIYMKKLHVPAPLMKIRETATLVGLTPGYLRRGCISGDVPCVKAGRAYLVNVPKLLDQLGVDYEEVGNP